MIDRAALLEKLAGQPDRIACRAHPAEPACALCEDCRAPLCAACLQEGSRCAACGPAARPGPLARAARWILTPLGGAVTFILLLSGLAATFRDRGAPTRTTSPDKESPEWRAAMAVIEKAWRLREAADVLKAHGDGGRAAFRIKRAAQLYREAMKIYPDNEPVANRDFTLARLRLAAADCVGGNEAKAIYEDLVKEHGQGRISILARLRWAAGAEHPADPKVLKHLEETAHLVTTRASSLERIARGFSHSAVEERKRQMIIRLTRTEIRWPLALAEAHYRLGEGYLATGDREKALKHFEEIVDAPEWREKASKRILELRPEAEPATSSEPEFRIERLDQKP